MTSRQRTSAAVARRPTDRTPVDFMAAPEIWERLASALAIDPAPFESLSPWLDPRREAVLNALQVDCRVISYDMFVRYPEHLLAAGERVDWWATAHRSTPNRMWRRIDAGGRLRDVWGVDYQRTSDRGSAQEQIAEFPLAGAERASDLQAFAWPSPDWWDFSAAPRLIDDVLRASGPLHLRYRAGSVFEIAWQLCGMEKLLADLLIDHAVPRYIMDRVSEVQIEIMKRFLAAAGDRVAMVYFYDDVGATQSLLVSRELWSAHIRPYHARLLDLARSMGLETMYHTDGAVDPLIGDFIDMGVDVLSPIQPEVAGFDARTLKERWGSRLSFHGGVSVTEVLPRGSPAEVRRTVRNLVQTLGSGGGYIMASSHHMQADTPVENVLAMYDPALR